MKWERKKSRDDRSVKNRVNNWRLPQPIDPALVGRVSRDTGVISEVASILLRRSGSDTEKALSLLRGSVLPHLPTIDPSALPDMCQAVSRLAASRNSCEHVVIYSDFDCDGVTSAAILSEALEQAGFEDFEVYFPSRAQEGYGFHPKSAALLAEKGTSLFVTADCGISGHEACDVLNAMGKDVIVTDHHLPGASLPRAVAVIDPHLPSWSGLGLTGLSGAGVAYLVSVTLLRHLGVAFDPYWAHDLLTLSIAGDGQPVTGSNREWIRSGLSSMSSDPRPGIRALLLSAGLAGPPQEDPRRLTFDRDVTYGIVPRINAAGRLSDPRLAYELLLTKDQQRAADLALELDKLNRQRREIEERILEECWDDLPEDGYAMCAFRPGWHEGVIGIACSRIREATGRPVALAAGEGEILKGSVRGVPGFNVVAALERCSKMLAAYGGHEGAGGFSIEKDKVGEFFAAFGDVSGEVLESSAAVPGIGVDEVISFGRVTGDNLRSILDLEPFGEGNPMPQVACMDAEVVGVGLMGSTLDHMQVVLGRDGVTQRFIWFGQGSRARDVALLGRADALFTPYRSMYRGREQFSPLIRELRPSWALSSPSYSEIASALPKDGPVILYTWSEDAGASLATALWKSGRPCGLHLKGRMGAGALEARSVLRDGGVVVSTAPWEIGSGAKASAVIHPPVDGGDVDRLRAFMKVAPLDIEVHISKEDAMNWLSWTYPDKDQLRCLWKFLTGNYAGGRAPICDLGRRWDEILEAAGYAATRTADGGRRFLKSGFAVFEEVGLATYDTSRRSPEYVLRIRDNKVELESSKTFVSGEECRRRAKALWQDEVEGY